jgi:hypothetical protein
MKKRPTKRRKRAFFRNKGRTSPYVTPLVMGPDALRDHMAALYQVLVARGEET